MWGDVKNAFNKAKDWGEGAAEKVEDKWGNFEKDMDDGWNDFEDWSEFSWDKTANFFSGLDYEGFLDMSYQQLAPMLAMMGITPQTTGMSQQEFESQSPAAKEAQMQAMQEYYRSQGINFSLDGSPQTADEHFRQADANS